MAEEHRHHYETNDVSASEPHNETPEAPKAKSEQRIGRAMLFKLAMCALVVSSLIISVTCLMKYNQQQEEIRELTKEEEEYKEKINELNYFLKRGVDREYVIEYARKYLGLNFPDEDIYHNDVNTPEN